MMCGSAVNEAFVEACLVAPPAARGEGSSTPKKEKEEEEAWLKKWREVAGITDRIEAEKVAKHKAHEHDVKYVTDEQVDEEEASAHGRSA